LKGSHVELHNTDAELRTTKREMERLAGADDELMRLRSAAEHIAAELEKRDAILHETKADTARLRAENLKQDEMLADMHRQLHERDQELFRSDQTVKRLQFALEQRGGSKPASGDGEHLKHKSDSEKAKGLRHACATGDIKKAQQWLDADADPDIADDNGLNALLWASQQGHESIVDLLCNADASLNIKDVEGWTPIYVATSCGHLEVVRILMDAGADHTIAATDGTTPLSVAKGNSNKKLVSLLSKKLPKDHASGGKTGGAGNQNK